VVFGFALAFLEGIEIVEQVVAYFFQIVGDARRRDIFL